MAKKKKTAKKAVKKTVKKVVKKAAKKAAKKTVKKSKPAPKKVVKKAAKKAVKKAAKKPTAGKAKVGKAKAAKPAAVVAKPKPSIGINPYLTFPGTCEEAFNFYKSVFGGNFPYIGRFGEMPPMDGKVIPAEEANKIMHVSLPIGNNSLLMGSDSSDAFGHASVIGNNFSISINATSALEADKIYKGLSAGGMQTMPMSKTFWGSYFGMLTDKFGIQWMLSYDTGEKM